MSLSKKKKLILDRVSSSLDLICINLQIITKEEVILSRKLESEKHSGVKMRLKKQIKTLEKQRKYFNEMKKSFEISLAVIM